MLFIMLIRIKTTSLLSFKLRNPGKCPPFTSCSHIYTRLGVEGIYQTRCIEPTRLENVEEHLAFRCLVHRSHRVREDHQ